MASPRKYFKSKPKKSESKFIQRDIHSIGRMGTISESKSGPRELGCWFLWANFILLTGGRNILAVSGKRGNFPGSGPLPIFWPFIVRLGTVVA